MFFTTGNFQKTKKPTLFTNDCRTAKRQLSRSAKNFLYNPNNYSVKILQEAKKTYYSICHQAKQLSILSWYECIRKARDSKSFWNLIGHFQTKNIFRLPPISKTTWKNYWLKIHVEKTFLTTGFLRNTFHLLNIIFILQ